MADDTDTVGGPLTTARDAYRQIKDLIITLDLRPGSTVHEAELQRKLGMGRTPVREALGQLAQDGMLEIFPRRAIVVAKLGVTEVLQLFEMRVVVESDAAALAAERVSESELDELMALGRELRTSRSHVDALQFLHVDQTFHRAIAQAARNRYLASSIDHVLTLNHWLWHIYFDARGARGEDLFTHDAIVDALRDHNAIVAGAAMREHILCSKEQLLTGL